MASHKATRRGFKRTSSLLEQRIRKAGESRGFSVSRLLTHWVEVVGSDLSAMAHPVTVKYGREGMGATLTVLTTGPMAPMLEMQKETLRQKVNAVYGYNAISRVHITQTAPIGFAEGQATFMHAKKADVPVAPDPEIVREASDAARPVSDEGLRAALDLLGRNVLTKNRKIKHNRSHAQK